MPARAVDVNKADRWHLSRSVVRRERANQRDAPNEGAVCAGPNSRLGLPVHRSQPPRNASVGLTAAARRAGIQLAASATNNSTAQVTARISGSVGLTSNNSDRMNRVTPIATNVPITTP